MKDKTSVNLSQWNQLSQSGKEKLKMWSLSQGYGLELIPGISGSFDPSCDYAALLTYEQLIKYIHQKGKRIVTSESKTCKTLWNVVIDLVENI